MLSEDKILDLLRPFGIELTERQTAQLIAYLGLLMRWNEKINLTSIRTPEECVTRHFAESIFLARHEQLDGRLLDIGSGAGFPGLALKLAVPELAVTLLEPIAKKRAFLKEVVRSCSFEGVEVRRERLQEVQRETQYDAITMRAVGSAGGLVIDAAPLLKPTGRLYLWLSKRQIHELLEITSGCMTWGRPIEIPESSERVILAGSLKDLRFT